MDLTIVWAIVVAFALVVEFITMQMVSIWIAVGALFAFVMNLCGISLAWQIITGGIVAILAIVFLRKFALRFLNKTDDAKPNTMIGKQVEVCEDISPTKPGAVKLGGVLWTAIADQNLEKNQTATIVEVVGNKLKVKGE